ncbi:glycosyltransferase [Dietzia kunjamensis]|uniref:glycosyltransferase n=1 Tax=Dietzia kunjamensis TaxID=322509 RepID=UPI0033673825
MHVIGNSDVSSLNRNNPAPERVAAFVQGLPPVGADAIGAVIRLNPVKGLEKIIAAAAKLRSQGSSTVVLLVGDGPIREELASLAAKLDVPLYMPGAAYSDRELALVYERLKVCVIPTLAGLSVMQSLSHGRPVVTHGDAYRQAPEFEAIREGVNGGLYRYGDIDDMSRKIGEWQEKMNRDPDGYAEQCRRSLDGYWTPKGQAALIAEILEKASG